MEEKIIERDDRVYFEVVGAGKIYLSDNAKWKCGGVTGFSLGATWGKHGQIGGVIAKEEAIKLANYILKKCK